LTAGTVVALQAPVTDDQAVACFARAEISAGSFPGTMVAVGEGTIGEAQGGAIPIDDAVAVCSDLWAQHVLDADIPSGVSTEPADRSFSHPVPEELAVCVLREGIAAVVPGPGTVCGELGLPEKLE
jgi:hypothetical protein